MNGIEVYGRGWKQPTVETTQKQNGVQLRIDDAQRPEVWTVVTITTAALLELLNLAGVEIDRGDPDGRYPPVPIPELPDLTLPPEIPPP